MEMLARKWTHLPVDVLWSNIDNILVIMNGFSHYQVKSEMNLQWHCPSPLLSEALTQLKNISKQTARPYRHRVPPRCCRQWGSQVTALCSIALLLDRGCILWVCSWNFQGCAGYACSAVEGEPVVLCPWAYWLQIDTFHRGTGLCLFAEVMSLLYEFSVCMCLYFVKQGSTWLFKLCVRRCMLLHA